MWPFDNMLRARSKGGDYEGVKNLLKFPMKYLVNVNARDKDGNTALMWRAFDNKNTEIAEALIEAGAKVDQPNNNGYTALMLASKNGYAEVVKSLVKARSKVDVANKFDETALILAAKNGRIKVVEALIEAGAKVDQPNNNGYTVLMLASENGHAEVVEFLVKVGLKVDVANKSGETALMLAAKNGHDEVVRSLIKHEVKVDAVDSLNQTALILAVRNGHDKVVESLIEARAKVDVVNSLNQTALMLASENGRIKIVKSLIEDGANVDVANKSGETALILAVRNGHNEVVESLIKAGANVGVVDKRGNTALNTALLRNNLKFNNAQTIQTLLENGASTETLDNVSKWRLSELAEKNKKIKDILETRSQVITSTAIAPDVNAVDKDGNTALMIAIKSNDNVKAKSLIDIGANVNIPNKLGNTPLILAAKNGNLEIAEAIIGRGANMDIANTFGQTALIWAALGGHLKIVEALINAGAKVNQVNDNNMLKALNFANRNIDIMNLLEGAKAKQNVSNNNVKIEGPEKAQSTKTKNLTAEVVESKAEPMAATTNKSNNASSGKKRKFSELYGCAEDVVKRANTYIAIEGIEGSSNKSKPKPPSKTPITRKKDSSRRGGRGK